MGTAQGTADWLARTSAPGVARAFAQADRQVSRSLAGGAQRDAEHQADRAAADNDDTGLVSARSHDRQPMLTPVGRQGCLTYLRRLAAGLIPS